MNQDIALWSPVIIASLKSPRSCQQERRYRYDPMIRRIDDIKIKVRNLRAERKGKAMEVWISLEIITVVDDSNGHTQLIDRKETIKERLPFQEFDSPIELDEEVGYIIQIKDLNWDGETQGNEVVITYFLNYMVFAVREQVVTLQTDNERKTGDEEEIDFNDIEIEIEQVRNDKEILKHKLFLYERDIMSLRRAIEKAEVKNTALSKELNGTRELVQKLREAITRKDLLICSYENHQPNTGEKTLPLPAWGGGEIKLGDRIKRMFMNSL